MGNCTSSKDFPQVRSRAPWPAPQHNVLHSRRPSRSSLHVAVQSSDVCKLAKLLLQGHKPNVYDKAGLTPLHLACEIGDENLVTLLIYKGAGVNHTTKETHGFSTPLIYAASNGNAECVHLLLCAGAYVDAVDEWGNSALFKAASYNHVDCVRLLLEHGACPNIGNRWGALPLQYAALQGHTEIVRLLINHNCDVTKLGEETVAPALTAAAMRGYHGCVQMLLKAGARVDFSPNNNGETALYHAIKYCQHATNGYGSNNSIATVSDRFACIQSLLHYGATISRPCLELLCIDGFFSTLLSKDNLLLYKLILRAFPFDQTSRPFLECLFEDMVRVHRWEVVQLLLSVGYTPTKANVDEVSDSLLDEHWHYLERVRKNPRSLQDLTRMKVRKCLPKNVIYSAPYLHLPKLLEDYVVIKTPGHYSYSYEHFNSDSLLAKLLQVS